MKKAFISPQILKTLRSRKSWSQKELANRSKLTSRSISKLEKNKAEQVSVQQKTLKGLCGALGVYPEVLSGEANLPIKASPLEVSIKMDPLTRLNFDLIEKRYGVSFDDIIDIAPMLFVEAAEASLSKLSNVSAYGTN